MHVLCFSVQREKKVEWKIKTQNILLSSHILVSVELVSHIKYIFFLYVYNWFCSLLLQYFFCLFSTIFLHSSCLFIVFVVTYGNAKV